MPIPTITGSNFNFSAYYTPTSWSGIHIYNFGIGFTNVNQIWADESYVYVACKNGLNIIDAASELQFSYITYNDGFTSVWANQDKVFLGTLNSGIKYINKSCISGSLVLPIELTCLQTYADVPKLRSSEVRYLHGQGDLLVCCTSSGIQSLGVYGYESETITTDAWKCFMTSATAIYYTVSGSVWSLNKVNGAQNDWTVPHTTYSADGSLLASGISLNDLFIVGNTVFTATSSGVYVINEASLEYVIYGDENFTSVWASPHATLSGGIFYVTTNSGLYAISLPTLSVVDYYTTTQSGSRGEKLASDDIVDLYVQGA